MGAPSAASTKWHVGSKDPRQPQELVRPDLPHQLVRPELHHQLVGPDKPNKRGVARPTTPPAVLGCAFAARWRTVQCTAFFVDRPVSRMSDDDECPTLAASSSEGEDEEPPSSSEYSPQSFTRKSRCVNCLVDQNEQRRQTVGESTWLCSIQLMATLFTPFTLYISRGS